MNITQRIPEIDHYGKRIPEGSIFFKIPENIGEIVSASTSYSEGQKPLTYRERNLEYLRNISIAIALSAIIILAGQVVNPIWLFIWGGVPIILAILISRSSTKFEGVCNYIGTNGFAEYTFLNSPDNVTTNYEISFNNVTDLLKGSTVKKRNFGYVGTDYFFFWLNNGKEAFKMNDSHENKNNEPGKYPFEYYFMALAVDQWTKKLVGQFSDKLRQDNFLEFNLIDYKEDKWITNKHIRLGVGYIELIYSDKTVRYNHDEIKEIYFHNGSLYMEHKNYEKKLLGFVEKGDKVEIPLINLSNQAYFFYAFEKLMGYSL